MHVGDVGVIGVAVSAGGFAILAGGVTALLTGSAGATQVIDERQVVEVAQLLSGDAQVTCERHREQGILQGALGWHLVSKVGGQGQSTQQLGQAKTLATISIATHLGDRLVRVAASAQWAESGDALRV
jgi:hypothetical protein